MANYFTCCAGCTPETGRHVGCHSTCKKYIEDKKAYDKRQKNLREAKSKESFKYSSYIYS